MNANAPIETAERIDEAAQLVVAARHGEAAAPLRAILERERRSAGAINALTSIALARRDGKRACEISRRSLVVTRQASLADWDSALTEASASLSEILATLNGGTSIP
jgi:hypothetical protein